MLKIHQGLAVSPFPEPGPSATHGSLPSWGWGVLLSSSQSTECRALRERLDPKLPGVPFGVSAQRWTQPISGRAVDGGGAGRATDRVFKAQMRYVWTRGSDFCHSGELYLWGVATSGERPRPCLGILGTDWRGGPGPECRQDSQDTEHLPLLC